MTNPQLIRIVGVTAVWVIFLSSLRFAAAGMRELWPVACARWHLLTCRSGLQRSCQRRWQMASASGSWRPSDAPSPRSLALLNEAD